MPKITLQQMVQQWLGASHKFEVNVSHTAAEAAILAEETFKESFSLKRFNSKGAPAWRPLQGRANPGHLSLLYETGALKNSINHKMSYGIGGAKASVFTDEKYFWRENRNTRGKCFAAIHNSGGSIEADAGSNASRIYQRQFMPTENGEVSTGDSSIMIDYYNQMHTKIFYGLPT